MKWKEWSQPATSPPTRTVLTDAKARAVMASTIKPHARLNRCGEEALLTSLPDIFLLKN
ncbi:hypothetical protein [Thermofilum sp.]|uniref:hypothetical protein n=1 Tax=Thermofilum sp. TaxID=1961369 RepID=UPI003163E3A1